MTQFFDKKITDIDKEREAFEKVFKLPIYLAWDNKFEGYIPKNKNDESSKLAAYAYDNRFQGWLARAQSQNEQQPKQIPDGWKLIGKVSEMGIVWHKHTPHAHPVGTELYAVTPTTCLTSETNTEVGE